MDPEFRQCYKKNRVHRSVDVVANTHAAEANTIAPFHPVVLVTHDIGDTARRVASTLLPTAAPPHLVGYGFRWRLLLSRLGRGPATTRHAAHAVAAMLWALRDLSVSSESNERVMQYCTAPGTLRMMYSMHGCLRCILLFLQLSTWSRWMLRLGV